MFKFRARLASQLFKATAYCFSGRPLFRQRQWLHANCALTLNFIFSNFKSLQLNRVKFLRKSYPRAGKAFVLNKPIYNMKICDYFFMFNLDKSRFPYCKYCKNPDFQCFNIENHAWLARLNGSLICVNALCPTISPDDLCPNGPETNVKIQCCCRRFVCCCCFFFQKTLFFFSMLCVLFIRQSTLTPQTLNTSRRL